MLRRVVYARDQIETIDKRLDLVAIVDATKLFGWQHVAQAMRMEGVNGLADNRPDAVHDAWEDVVVDVELLDR